MWISEPVSGRLFYVYANSSGSGAVSDIVGKFGEELDGIVYPDCLPSPPYGPDFSVTRASEFDANISSFQDTIFDVVPPFAEPYVDSWLSWSQYYYFVDPVYSQSSRQYFGASMTIAATVSKPADWEYTVGRDGDTSYPYYLP